MSPEEKRKWTSRALKRMIDRVTRDSEAHYRAWMDAGRPGTAKYSPPDPGDDHYDPDGYCDNPGRGF